MFRTATTKVIVHFKSHMQTLQQLIVIISLVEKFLDKPVGGKIRSSEGEVPWLPTYKYHPVWQLHILPLFYCHRNIAFSSCC